MKNRKKLSIRLQYVSGSCNIVIALTHILNKSVALYNTYIFFIFFTVPGVSEYLATTTSFGKGQNWMKGLDNDDKAFLICKFTLITSKVDKYTTPSQIFLLQKEFCSSDLFTVLFHLSLIIGKEFSCHEHSSTSPACSLYCIFYYGCSSVIFSCQLLSCKY